MVAARLRELGAVLVDADALAREVVEPDTPRERIKVRRLPRDLPVPALSDQSRLQITQPTRSAGNARIEIP